MKMKRIHVALVLLVCLAAAGMYVLAQGGPAQQQTTAQVLTGQGNAVGNARGKGKLMELKVPEAIAFKTDNGRNGWKVKIPGGRPLATPAVVGGTIFIGGGFGSHEFYALDSHTGKRRWTFKCGDDGPTAAVAAEGCVAYNTESCTIYIHDLKTGKVLWHKWLGDPLMSQPAIGAGKVFMAYPGKGGHRLAAFELRTGKRIWEQPIAGEVITAPVVAGAWLVAATVDGTLYRFDLATGKVIWSKKHKVTSAPRVVGKRILISQRDVKTVEITDEKGKKISSKITVEGLNVVSLTDGAIAHAKPLSPVKAAFLLNLRGQGVILTANNAVSIGGQMAYRNAMRSYGAPLRSIGGSRAGQAEALSERIGQLRRRKVSTKPAEGRRDAEEAIKIAEDIEKIAAGKAANEKEKLAAEKLKSAARKLRTIAAKTKQAAEAAEQAEKTIAATKVQVRTDKAHDALVGFAAAPAAAKLALAGGNIGQGTVKAVWAYQGSRPCLFGDKSVMVHGRKMRAVEIATGKVVWERTFDFKADATRPVTPPALAGEKLYVGTTDGRIICLAAATGKILWQEKVGGRILFEPAVVKGRLYAATSDGTLICLETGDKTADGWAMWGGSAKHNGSAKP